MTGAGAAQGFTGTWHKANPVLKCPDVPSGLAAHEKPLAGMFLQFPPCFLMRQPRAARVRVLGLVVVGGRVRWLWVVGPVGGLAVGRRARLRLCCAPLAGRGLFLPRLLLSALPLFPCRPCAPVGAARSGMLLPTHGAAAVRPLSRGSFHKAEDRIIFTHHFHSLTAPPLSTFHLPCACVEGGAVGRWRGGSPMGFRVWPTSRSGAQQTGKTPSAPIATSACAHCQFTFLGAFCFPRAQ